MGNKLETLEEIEEFAREEYAPVMEIHNSPKEDYVKITNGSAAHEMRVSIGENKLHINGQRYDEEKVRDVTCDKDEESLDDELRRVL